jgi:hypothetical protein
MRKHFAVLLMLFFQSMNTRRDGKPSDGSPSKRKGLLWVFTNAIHALLQTAQSMLFLYFGVQTFTQGTSPCNHLVEFQRAAISDARSICNFQALADSYGVYSNRNRVNDETISVSAALSRLRRSEIHPLLERSGILSMD